MSSTIISAGLKSRVRLNESTIPDEVFKLSANTEHYRYIFLEKNKYLKQRIFMCLISLMQFEVLFLGLFSTELFYIFTSFLPKCTLYILHAKVLRMQPHQKHCSFK